MKKLQLVIATRNAKKLREIQQILSDLPVELLTLNDFPAASEVEEDAPTFEGNARKKALETADTIGEWVVADDSGLEVDSLGGRPGVMSARYTGPDADDEDRYRKVLAEMKGVPTEKRTARFRCVAALARPGEIVFTVEGRCEGFIASEPCGTGGFGYDPIFYCAEYGRTFGELSSEEKHNVSHRGKALAAFKQELRRLLKDV